MKNSILISYYSWSDNTGHVAQLIRRITGGSTFRITPDEEYSGSYQVCLDRARKEVRAGIAPEINDIPSDLASFDTVCIGTPNWCGTMAPPVLSFIKQADLSGKKILPFCTHGGGGAGRFYKDIKNACPESEILEALALYGSGGRSAESEITAWLTRNAII